MDLLAQKEMLLIITSWTLPWVILHYLYKKFTNRTILTIGLTLCWLIQVLSHIYIIRQAQHLNDFPFSGKFFWVGFMVLIIQSLPNVLYSVFAKNKVHFGVYIFCWLILIPAAYHLYLGVILVFSLE